MRSVAPGSSFETAVKIDMDPGWHTYWRNPGDAGIPPRIEWRLPTGWKAGEIQWPVPHKLISPEVVSFGYEHEAMLLVRITAPKSATPGSTIFLRAKVDWLVCSAGCIPASAMVETAVRVAPASAPNQTWSGKILDAERALPGPSRPDAFSAALAGKSIVLSFAGAGPKITSVTFYPADPVVEPSAPQTLKSTGEHPTLTMQLSQFAPASVPRLRGLLISQSGANSFSQTIDIPLRRAHV